MTTGKKTPPARKPVSTPPSSAQPADPLAPVKAKVMEAFGGYRKAWETLVERALAHGRALLELQRECIERKVSFDAVLDEMGVPRSTAYDHKILATVWDQAQDGIRAMGLRVEGLGIYDIIRLVPKYKDYKRTKDKEEEAPKEPEAKGEKDREEGTDAGPNDTGEGDADEWDVDGAESGVVIQATGTAFDVNGTVRELMKKWGIKG